MTRLSDRVSAVWPFLLATVLQSGSFALAFPFIARSLGSTDAGVLALIATTSLAVGALLDGGCSPVVTRDLVVDGGHLQDHAWRALSASSIFLAAILAVLTLVTPLLNARLSDQTFMLVLGCGVVGISVAVNLRWQAVLRTDGRSHAYLVSCVICYAWPALLTALVATASKSVNQRLSHILPLHWLDRSSRSRLPCVVAGPNP